MNVARPQRAGAAALALGLPLLGACAGALSAALAFAVHPAATPVVVGFAALAAVSLARMEIGVAAALALLPLGYVVETAGPPWLAGSAWIGVLFALALGRWLGSRHPARAMPRLVWVLAVFVVVGFVGVATSDELEPALPFVRSLVVGLALTFVIATQIRTLAQVRTILLGFSLATLGIGAYAAYLYLGDFDTTSGFFTASGELARRVSAGFAQPNQLGGILVLLLPFSVAGALIHRGAAPLHLAAIVLGSYGVYVSFSRGALVALLAIPLVFARRRTLLLAAPVLVAAIVLATPDLVRERFATLTEQGSEIATRLDFWRVAVTVWSEAPILGAGVGSFPDAYATARIPGKEFLPATIFEPPPHAHNLALQTLAEQGLIGLVALVAVIAAAAAAALALRRAAVRWIRVVGTASLASLVALLVHNLVDVTLLEVTATLFWASLGLTIGLHQAASRARTGDPSMET